MNNIRRENYVLKAFAASTALAAVTLVLAMGLINMFKYGLPLPMPVILILGAVIFVLSASFFERYEVGSMAWSMLVTIITTLILSLIAGGIIHLASMKLPGWEDILSGVAVSMVVSMVLLNYLKRSLGQIEGY